MDQGLKSDTVSENEQVTGRRGDAENHVSPGSYVGDNSMASHRKSVECQNRTGILVGNPLDNVELYGASETVKPVTAPVALMFTAPLPVPEPSKNGNVLCLGTFTPKPMAAAVTMHPLWQEDSAVDEGTS